MLAQFPKIRTFFYIHIIATILGLRCSHDISSTSIEDTLNYEELDALASSIDEDLTTANTKFALKIFHALHNKNKTDNIFISPLSISIALAMTNNGALDQTQDAISNTLEFHDMSLSMVNDQFSKLLKSIQHFDANVELAAANSIWINKEFPVKKDFVQTNQDYYIAKVSNLDFTQPDAADIINSWVRQNTNGKISDILKQVAASDIMFIINALYFKGDWKFQFDEKDTDERTFFLPNGATKKVQMMSNGGREYTYYFNDIFAAVRMPYGRNKVSMYVFLPNYGYDLDDFMAELNLENWTHWMASFDSLPAPDPTFIFRLPKFKLEYEKVLNEILKSLGMQIAFTPAANFRGISDFSFWIGFVKQKAFIEINEEGSEAAAVTVVSPTRSTPPNFTANHPFFFVIRDDRSKTVLFMGTLIDPVDE